MKEKIVMAKALFCPKCDTEYWGLATGKNGASCNKCGYRFTFADVNEEYSKCIRSV